MLFLLASADPGGGMSWWQALILGLVEGITEYLPVSSTGHLVVTQRAMGMGASEAANAYAICIQAGAIVAVLGLYRMRVAQMWNGLFGKDPAGRQLVINLIAAFIPAVVLALLLQKLIKKYLFGDAWGLWPIIAAWFVGGIAILAVNRYRKHRQEENRPRRELEDLTVKHAVIIGVGQCLAMWPGTSRSLVTIVGGILVGLRMQAAVEFSFLLGLLTLSAATAKDGLDHGREMLETFGPASMAIGFFAAWLSAVLAVKWMVAYLNRHGLSIFGWYRIGIAVITALLVMRGLI